MPTVQEALEQALYQLFKQNIRVTGASRTDTGTHAISQTAHFDLNKPKPKGLSLCKALNFYLPEDIQVRRAWEAPSSFHALRSSTAKSYVYCVFNRSQPSVFLNGEAFWYPYKMDLLCLQQMSRLLKGRHDFKSFQNSGTNVTSTCRTIYQARWLVRSKNIFLFYIKGDGFLKQMIRNLVGTQLSLLAGYSLPGRGKPVPKVQALEILKKWEAILEAKDRKAALKTAPASGLYLYKVYYPVALDKQCRSI